MQFLLSVLLARLCIVKTIILNYIEQLIQLKYKSEVSYKRERTFEEVNGNTN